MKYQIVIASFLISFSLLAEAANWTYVKTPRGTDLEIKIIKTIRDMRKGNR